MISDVLDYAILEIENQLCRPRLADEGEDLTPHLEYLASCMRRIVPRLNGQKARQLRFPVPPDPIVLCNSQPCLPGCCRNAGRPVK